MKLRTRTLRPGMRLYHGTSAEFDETSGELAAPAWFSEKPRVSRHFVTWHRSSGRNLPRIVEFRVSAPLRLLLIPDKEAMDELVELNGWGIWDNETASDWICQQGYDGWIVPNNYPDEGGADIMLCRTESLQYVKTEPVGESSIYSVTKRIDEIMGGSDWPDEPSHPIRPSPGRMQWKPGDDRPDNGHPVAIKKHPRFQVDLPTEKVELNYLDQSHLDELIARIRAEEAQPPHKKNAARINAMKQQAMEMMRRLESQWVLKNADKLLPILEGLYRLTFDGGAMECPYCKTPLAVEWDTEYGDPLFGEHDDAECPQCGKKFQFSVFPEYTASPL